MRTTTVGTHDLLRTDCMIAWYWYMPRQPRPVFCCATTLVFQECTLNDVGKQHPPPSFRPALSSTRSRVSKGVLIILSAASSLQRRFASQDKPSKQDPFLFGPITNCQVVLHQTTCRGFGRETDQQPLFALKMRRGEAGVSTALSSFASSSAWATGRGQRSRGSTRSTAELGLETSASTSSPRSRRF